MSVLSTIHNRLKIKKYKLDFYFKEEFLWENQQYIQQG